MTGSDDIKPFVREKLGCNCPDDVFNHISVISHPESFRTYPVDCLVGIGGRLLLAVVTQRARLIPACLKEIISAGRQYRDAHGFNRFRLVVAATEPNIRNEIQSAFDSLALKDEKLHLHMVDPEVVAFLKQPGICGQR